MLLISELAVRLSSASRRVFTTVFMLPREARPPSCLPCFLPGSPRPLLYGSPSAASLMSLFLETKSGSPADVGGGTDVRGFRNDHRAQIQGPRGGRCRGPATCRTCV